jgi:hypothetical protein
MPRTESEGEEMSRRGEDQFILSESQLAAYAKYAEQVINETIARGDESKRFRDALMGIPNERIMDIFSTRSRYREKYGDMFEKIEYPMPRKLPLVPILKELFVDNSFYGG